MRMLLSFALLLTISGGMAWCAGKRGRDPVGWFLIGLLLGLFGLIVLLILPKAKAKGVELETDEDNLLTDFDDSEEGYATREWYYLDSSHTRFGPCSFDGLRMAWEEGAVHEGTYVWCDGMERWEKVVDLPLLQDVLAPVKA